MFRDDDANRVAAVQAAGARGDVATMVTAALELWLAARDERTPDEATMQVWDLLGEQRAEVLALEALLGAVRAGQRPRPAPFVLLVTSLLSEQLVELADRVIEAGWSAQYLSVLIDQLVEAGEPALVEGIIRKHAATLAARTDTWTAIGYVLTSTRVGDRHAVDDWFRDWEARPHVPMWLIAYYAASWMPIVKNPWPRLIALAKVALATTEPDDTALFFETFIALDELGQDRVTEFRARMATLRPRLDEYLKDYQDTAATYDPKTYVVFGPAASLVGLISAALWAKDQIAGRTERPQQELGARAYTIVRHCFRSNLILGHVLTLLDAERDSPAAAAAFHDMVDRPIYPMIERIWKELTKTKLSWAKRMKLAHFS